jgi:hypothetical protein
LVAEALEARAIVLYGPLSVSAKATDALVIDEYGDEGKDGSAQPPARY